MVTTERTRERIPRWYDARSPREVTKPYRKSVVETVELGLDVIHQQVFADLEMRVARAVGGALGWLKERLRVTMADDPTGTTQRKRLLAADLVLEASAAAGLPEWVQALLAETPGDIPVPKDPFAIRIAWGVARERTEGATRVRSWKAAHRDPKFQLQQLFLRILPPEVTAHTPVPLRPGLTQEVAQQLTSHLMLADSGTVVLAAFPTTEERDPLIRRARWETVVEKICRRSVPFPYERARVLNPQKYAAGDRRGDRLVNTDQEWRIVVRSPEARRAPLLYVMGKNIRLFRRSWRSTRQGQEGHSRSGTFVALRVDRPFLYGQPPDVREHLEWWRRPGVLETLTPLVPGTPRLTARQPCLLIPLAYGRRRTEGQVFPALTRLPIQWTRVVHRSYRRGEEREKWFLQLTIGYAAMTPLPTRVLGIHFGLLDTCYWALLEDRGPEAPPVLLEEGTQRGNPILAHGLAEKQELEWDQAKGRWVGGDVYAPALRGDTHLVSDGILRMAFTKGTEGVPAGLGLERIRWVPKGQGPPEANRRFSAWNYGQLPTILGYKGPAAGIWVTEVMPAKTDRQQDDAEQARRIARKAVQRLRERRRRLEEAAADARAENRNEE